MICQNSYRRYFLFLWCVAGSITIPLAASSSTFKTVQEKLDALKSGVQQHQAILSLVGAAAVYGTYKKSTTLQGGVQSSWQQMKAKSQELYEKYNKPVTLGFWARLGGLLMGGNFVYSQVSTLEKKEIATFLKKNAAPIISGAEQVKEKFNALSTAQKVAASIGLTAGVAGGVYVLKKAYNKYMRKDRKTAFAEFKAALSDQQRTRYTALIDQIEKNSDVFYTDCARDFLTELTHKQYILAEHILEAELR